MALFFTPMAFVHNRIFGACSCSVSWETWRCECFCLPSGGERALRRPQRRGLRRGLPHHYGFTASIDAERMKFSIPLSGDQSFMNCRLSSLGWIRYSEACLGQHRVKLIHGGGARNAGGIGSQVVFQLLGNRCRGYCIRHGEAPAAFQHTEGFSKDLRLLRREIDDAIRDDHVNQGVGHGQVLDLAEPELHVREPRLLCVPSGEAIMSGVMSTPITLPGPRPPGRQGSSRIRPATEIEDRLARLQRCDGLRMPQPSPRFEPSGTAESSSAE